MFFALSVIAGAQAFPLSFGVKAGVVANKDARNGSEERIFPLLGGPFLEISLPFLPTIETGILFQRYEFGKVSSATYEVPLLVKKRFSTPVLKPYFAAGATIRMLPSLDTTHGGATFACGLTIAVLPIKIEPEVRYTRWINSRFSPRESQTEFLVGFRF